MKILSIISGEYGKRHVENIKANGPQEWEVFVWQAPTILPPVIDYPEDYLPTTLPLVDLILSFAEQRGVAELIPDIAGLTKAKAVIAGIDSEAWLPRGLARQLREWLKKMGVDCATPKPLCSLNEKNYLITRRQRLSYDSPYIAEFATYFGQPDFDIEVDAQTRTILAIKVKHDAVCGCARFVAQKLAGISVEEAEQAAGLAHHHYPCLASMGKDPDFGDTLMHISGNILKDNVVAQIKPYKQISYLTPGKLADE